MKFSSTLIRTLLFSTLLLALPNRGYSYGQEGHEAVAILALQKLEADKAAGNAKAAKALDQIKKILGNKDMAAVAVFADWVRLGETNHLRKAAIKDINIRFPGNDTWHFVDMPLGTTLYNDDAVSANGDDVVHGINKCITMLETADSSTQKDHHTVALKFLIHLAGDIHQPLHVACGYYRWNFKGIVRDPAPVTIGQLPHDRGGNKLLVTTNGNSENLHHIWDSDLVFIQVDRHSSVPGADIAARLGSELVPNLFPAQTGDHHGWAAKWATDSTKMAKLAYANIKVPAIPLPPPHHSKTEIPKTPMTGFDKDNYVNANSALAKKQLLKAGWRLAELLENLDWHD